MSEVTKVTVIVYGAKNLKGKKKDRHKYSVVFGIGDKKFSTEVNVEPGGCPAWNEESVIEVENSQYPLVLTVKEKDDPLGQLIVPLSKLPVKELSKPLTSQLQPHKKCPNPQGELIYKAWLSQKLPPSITVTDSSIHNQPSTLEKFKNHIKKSPLLHRKTPVRKSSNGEIDLPQNNLASSKVSFRSMQDLSQSTFHVAISDDDSDNPTAAIDSVSSLVNSSLAMTPAVTPVFLTPGPPPVKGHRRYGSHMDIESHTLRPVIYSITPSEGPSTGGTKVSITGENLGTHLEDVVGLTICGANCLRSVEYVSSKTLRCTTKAYRACKGFVSVETQSGGKGTSLVQFRFTEEREPPDGGTSTTLICNPKTEQPRLTKTPELLKKGLFSRNSDKEKEREINKEKEREISKGLERELMEEIKKLKAENQELKEQNETMKLYIDNLVARVMEECPDALASPKRLRSSTK